MDILSRKPGEKVKWESVTGFPVYAVYGRVGHSIVGAKEERERFRTIHWIVFIGKSMGGLPRRNS